MCSRMHCFHPEKIIGVWNIYVGKVLDETTIKTRSTRRWWKKDSNNVAFPCRSIKSHFELLLRLAPFQDYCTENAIYCCQVQKKVFIVRTWYIRIPWRYFVKIPSVSIKTLKGEFRWVQHFAKGVKDELREY